MRACCTWNKTTTITIARTLQEQCTQTHFDKYSWNRKHTSPICIGVALAATNNNKTHTHSYAITFTAAPHLHPKHTQMTTCRRPTYDFIGRQNAELYALHQANRRLRVVGRHGYWVATIAKRPLVLLPPLAVGARTRFAVVVVVASCRRSASHRTHKKIDSALSNTGERALGDVRRRSTSTSGRVSGNFPLTMCLQRGQKIPSIPCSRRARAAAACLGRGAGCLPLVRMAESDVDGERTAIDELGDAQ